MTELGDGFRLVSYLRKATVVQGKVEMGRPRKAAMEANVFVLLLALSECLSDPEVGPCTLLHFTHVAMVMAADSASEP